VDCSSKGSRWRETRLAVRYVDGAFTIDGVAQGRPLDLYERLDLTQTTLSHQEERDALRARAREFIWDRWQRYRRAYIVFTQTTVDWISTSHIFIEPDETGRWRVAWRILQENASLLPREVTPHEPTGIIRDQPTFYVVERVDDGAASKEEQGGKVAASASHDSLLPHTPPAAKTGSIVLRSLCNP
jgi:hypothetical protein